MANKYLNGNSGNVWVNDKLLSNIKSIEAKVSGDFDEVICIGTSKTEYDFNGWTGEGTLVANKVDSTTLSLLAEAFKKGEMPEIKIITKLTDKSTGKSERTAIQDVVFTEFDLAKFEAKTRVEEEIPFKFSDYEILETI